MSQSCVTQHNVNETKRTHLLLMSCSQSHLWLFFLKGPAHNFLLPEYSIDKWLRRLSQIIHADQIRNKTSISLIETIFNLYHVQSWSFGTYRGHLSTSIERIRFVFRDKQITHLRDKVEITLTIVLFTPAKWPGERNGTSNTHLSAPDRVSRH